MISVSGKSWEEKTINKNLVTRIKQKYNLSNIISRLIISRKFNEEEIYLIENSLNLSNIFQNNKDFLQSVNVIESTINKKEKICILGDYDVDGSTATSLIARFLDDLNHPYFYYIPDREKDGYGASEKLFKKLILKKPKLIIMVDCGSTSISAVEYLNKKKIKSLIIDHHEINKPYPKANAIINPKKDNGYLDYDYLCSTSLVYFFLEILKKRIKSKIELRKYLIYVLLATVCDVMPIRKLNRVISILALKEFDPNNNIAFKELFKLIKKKNRINTNDLGYIIGPMLNAGGRIGKSSYATELLTSNDLDKIRLRSLQLFNLNKRRRKIEAIILDNIDFDKINNENKEIIIHYDSSIKEGLIGIIAARLKDYFNKPSIVITKSNELLKSSARSIYNYNIGRAIKNSLDQKIIESGGGHSMAAGFTLKKENLSKFKDFIINDYLKKNLNVKTSFNYDAEISPIAVNKDFLYDLKKLEPFGVGNPSPVFLLKGLKILKRNIHKDKHISCILKSKSGVVFNSIFFYFPNNKINEYLLNYKKYFNVVGQIDKNFNDSKKTPQLIIKDLII